MRAAVVIPTQTVEPVRSYTNASSARLYSQSPAWEMTRPLNRTRRSRWRSEMRNGRAGFSMRSPGVMGGTRSAERGSFRGAGDGQVVALAVDHVELLCCDEGGLRALAVDHVELLSWARAGCRALAVLQVHVHLVAPWGRGRHGQSMRLRPP